jgi:hypothetical protein
MNKEKDRSSDEAQPDREFAGNSLLEDDELGLARLPICREPWESYYILRRGILPCCHGNPIIAPMTDWEAAWNSAPIREIRSYLSRGKLSPYCLESLGCPIVQKFLEKKKKQSAEAAIMPPRRPFVLRLVNKLLLGIPGRLYRKFFRRAK